MKSIMMFVCLYIVSVVVTLVFVYKYGRHDREGGAIVAMMAFVPFVNVIMTGFCIIKQ